MRIFKTRWMARFARKSGIDDELLIEAIGRAERGLIDADLGGGVIKQRVGRPGQGRSGGYRTIIVFRIGDLAIFLFAFAKNERDNIDQDYLADLKQVAAKWLLADEAAIARAVKAGDIEEIPNAKK
ncbi:type II toxin-antitoxin system RelE/ParE family toxin [Rhizobium sp. LjRoot254]|uniref:type II toxin-antitoxin system RelE/ParE family toxin n=1 Tax=Rhizobium sp. LjRoot254 TaxID=3342297 RepID=UPI003ECE8E2C